MRVKGAILLGKEAAERSAAQVGAYDVLEKIVEKYGIPFQDGEELPQEFKQIFPRHDREDDIAHEIERKKALLNAGSPSASRGAEREIANDSDGSTESIPEAFRDSEESDGDGSVNVYDGDSDGDGQWEMDAEADPESDGHENRKVCKVIVVEDSD